MNTVWSGGTYDDPDTPEVNEAAQWQGGVIRDNVEVGANGDVYIFVNGDYYEGDKRGIQGDYGVEYNTGKRTGGAVMTKRTFNYGTFEVVMKIPSVNGVCTSLWLYNNFPTGVEGEDNHNYEIDIELHGTLPDGTGSLRNVLCTNWLTEHIYDQGYPAAPAALNDGQFHTYRIEWMPTYVKYYVDGQLVHTSTEKIPDNEMYLNIGCWFPRDWCGEPDFETDSMVIRSFGYAPYTQAQANDTHNTPYDVNNNNYHALPTTAATAPVVNLIANGGLDGTRTDFVWDTTEAAGYDGTGALNGTISQDVFLDCAGLELKLTVAGTGSLTVKVVYCTIDGEGTVTGEDSQTFDEGSGTLTFTPPTDCTKLTVQITSAGGTVTSVSLGY